jgi:hypothetical protein
MIFFQSRMRDLAAPPPLAAVAAVVISLALLPIAVTQVSSCSFPGVTCSTCLNRYTTGSSYDSSLTKCGWCGARSLNASDPSTSNGYCLEDNDPLKAAKCQDQSFMMYAYSRSRGTVGSAITAMCDTNRMTAAVFAGIAVGILALISAALCYWRATVYAGSRQFKWIFAGLFLPVLSVIIVEILAKKGHFGSSVHEQSAAAGTANAPTDPHSAAPNPMGAGTQPCGATGPSSVYNSAVGPNVHPQ